MERVEIKEKMLVWYRPLPKLKILCRVLVCARDYIGMRVVAATPAEVIASHYGVGESIYASFHPDAFEKAGE